MSLTFLPLDESKIPPASRELLDNILNWRPEWKKYCRMCKRNFGFALDILIPSPTGRKELEIIIWYENDANDLSIGFGPTHFHQSVQMETKEGWYEEWTILEALKLIVNSEIVTFYPVDTREGYAGLVYLTEPYPLLDEVTFNNAKQLRLLSWDGSIDRIIKPEDFNV